MKLVYENRVFKILLKFFTCVLHKTVLFHKLYIYIYVYNT